MRGPKRAFISAVTSPSALLAALSVHWLLLGAVHAQSDSQDSTSRIVSAMQSLVANKMVINAATTIIKYADSKLRQAIPNHSPLTAAHKLLKRLQDFCQTHLRSPLHFAIGLALAAQQRPARHADNNKLLHALVGTIAQRVPRWGLLPGNGMTPLATVCYYVPPEQTSASSSSCSSSSSSSSSSAWDGRVALLSLARELSRYSSAAIFTADSSGLLPLHAALKQGCLDVARFLYSQFPQAVPLVDDGNRSCLFHALARLAVSPREAADDRASAALGRCVLDLMQLYPSAAAEIVDDVKLEQRELFTELMQQLLDRRVQAQVATNLSSLTPVTVGTGPGPVLAPSSPIPPAADGNTNTNTNTNTNLSSSPNPMADPLDAKQDLSEPSAKRVRIADESESQAQRFSAVGALLLLKGSEDR